MDTDKLGTIFFNPGEASVHLPTDESYVELILSDGSTVTVTGEGITRLFVSDSLMPTVTVDLYQSIKEEENA